MISSTARDLPGHREKVLHACPRLGMFYPEMMEHLSAADANAVEVSLSMVEKAEVYPGVFGGDRPGGRVRGGGRRGDEGEG